MEEQLRNYFDRYVQLTDVEFALFFEHLSKVSFKKKDFLLEQGKVCQYRFFILEGLVRYFQSDADGKEHIGLFGIENWWVTNLESFSQETPSRNAIQALEETIVLQISKKDLEAMYLKIPKLERVFRIISENMLVALQRRDEVYMKRSSRERYFHLVDGIPNFAQRVPQYMIASYLDITPEYLSELRKSRS
ncbi:Crp/Fnr family transcriptional regulator [Spongiimicrobium salis]|uniref:Crp/Fnr family transcriptional regulator n=1 Tax=Spongiimicrobium salis TaxID=1667022 RepID=UPI00374CAA7A